VVSVSFRAITVWTNTLCIVYGVIPTSDSGNDMVYLAGSRTTAIDAYIRLGSLNFFLRFSGEVLTFS